MKYKSLFIAALSTLLFTACLWDQAEYDVSGTLYDNPENCQPVPDATLVFMSSYERHHPVASATTDSNGYFAVTFAQTSPISGYYQTKLSMKEHKLTIYYNDTIIFSEYDTDYDWRHIDTLYINTPEE